MGQAARKRPWLAAVLAMLSPGLGHLYLREWLRAVLWFGLILTTTSLLVPASPAPATLSAEAILQASLAAVRGIPVLNRLVLVAVTLLSMVDAYWMASRGNDAVEPEDGVACPHCGKETDEDLAFCHWCTNPLDRDAH